MKIKDEHYKQIVRGLESIEARLRFSMGEYQAAGHSTQRFMWDGLRSAKINGNSTKWICDELYTYMDDNHINSALRSAYAELGFLQKNGSEVTWIQTQAAQQGTVDSATDQDDPAEDEHETGARFAG